ncbi:MAG: HDOD domain-containing protein [Betaproteobacteria bacterium]
MSTQPVLCLQLLANRKLEPGAIKLRFSPGDHNTLLPFVADERFLAFAHSFPCVIATENASDFSPELFKALKDAGCHPTPQGSFHNSDENAKPVLPPHVEWLSGDWYLNPPQKVSDNQAASHSLSLKLLQLVAQDADTCEIETVFRQDPVLAYHLLRLVNSLGAGVGRRISSFSQAILILGRQQLKRWLNLMLFAANRDDFRTAMLMARVTLRSRSMELLAKAGGFDRTEQDQAFMAGMFSLLGILFAKPLSDILTPLKLNDSLAKAVLSNEGKLGRLLLAIKKLEQADETGLSELFDEFQLAPEAYNLVSLEAHQWMLNAIHDKSGASDA